MKKSHVLFMYALVTDITKTTTGTDRKRLPKYALYWESTGVIGTDYYFFEGRGWVGGRVGQFPKFLHNQRMLFHMLCAIAHDHAQPNSYPRKFSNYPSDLTAAATGGRRVEYDRKIQHFVFKRLK